MALWAFAAYALVIAANFLIVSPLSRRLAWPPTDVAKLGDLTGNLPLLASWLGEGPALRSFRRHASWYTKGFRGSAAARQRFMQVSTLGELDDVLATLDPNESFPASAMRVPRGKSSGTQAVSLPHGWTTSACSRRSHPRAACRCL